MQSVDNIIKDFTTKLQALILKTKQLKEQNAELLAVIGQREQEIKEQKKQIDEINRKYNTLMMAKMLSITDKDINTARQRINRLIQTIDRCIAEQNAKDA